MSSDCSSWCSWTRRGSRTATGPNGSRSFVHRFPALHLIWADGGYAGKLVVWVATMLQRTPVIVKRPRHTQGFQRTAMALDRRRTFGWLKRSRRLSKDFEALPETTRHGAGLP